MNTPTPSQSLMMLATGYWVPRCLHVVADLGVADELADAPQTSAALAETLHLHAQSLARVLRTLAAFGVFEEVEGGFRHTEASRLLRSDHPQSQRSFVRMMGMSAHWAAYGELEHSVRTGAAAMTRISAGGTFDYFATHPAESRLFDEAMTGKSHEAVQAVLGAYDFSGFKSIADIGGGRGHLLRAVLAANPAARGILCDLPHVISTLSSADRLALQAVDFFKDPLPVCDAYLLMSVIHDWGDAEATAILEAVRRAAPPHAKLLLLELVIPDAPGPHPAKYVDIEMLVMTSGGRERTRAQFEHLYGAAGFRLEKVVATNSATMILQGAVV